MIFPPSRRRIVQRIPGPGTAAYGAGDILVDDCGNRYRQVDAGEASVLRQGTANVVFTLYPDGSIG